VLTETLPAVIGRQDEEGLFPETPLPSASEKELAEARPFELYRTARV